MEHIRGSTFKKICTYKNNELVPQDLTNISIRSQIRTKESELIADISITKLPQTGLTLGQYLMQVSNTQGWLAGTASIDIEYTELSNIVITERASILIKEQVTKPVGQ